MTSTLMFLDVETTGFSPYEHEIIELAAAIVIDGVTQCEFTLYFRPEKWDNISERALEVNGWTVERLKRLPTNMIGYRSMVSILESLSMWQPGLGGEKSDRLTIVEHSKNGIFDIRFIKELLEKKFDLFFENKAINTRDLCKRKHSGRDHYTLKDCARMCDIPFDEELHHGAAYDRDIMMQIYRECVDERNQK